MNEFKKLIMMSQQEDVPYLCIEALENDMQVSLSLNDVEYSLDKLHWNILPANTQSPPIKAGAKMYFRANLKPHYVVEINNQGIKEVVINSSNGIGKFTITKKCNLSGTPLSLLFSTNIKQYDSLQGYSVAFKELFRDTPVVNILNSDFIPCRRISNCCCYGMFRNCSDLEYADLEIADEIITGVDTRYAFAYIFYNCKKLKFGIKELRHQLDAYELYYAYYNCTDLVRATDCTNVGKASASAMWYAYTNCTSLVNPPTINADESTANFLWLAFKGCTSLIKTHIVKGSKHSSARAFFQAWCDCVSLKEVWWLPLHATNQECNPRWLDNVASEGTVYLNKNITWNPEDYRNGSYTTNSSGESVKITWGFPTNWAIKYCDPDNVSDVRDEKW